MRTKDTPHITNTEIMREVANRTGLPFNATFQTIYAYHDIIKECIANGVEVQMGELGMMGWKIKPPHEGVVYYDFQTKQPLPPQDTPGFWIPKFAPRKKWKAELKELTKFWKNENEQGKEESDEEDDE